MEVLSENSFFGAVARTGGRSLKVAITAAREDSRARTRTGTSRSLDRGSANPSLNCLWLSSRGAVKATFAGCRQERPVSKGRARFLISAVLILLIGTSLVSAGEWNQVLSVGDAAPDWVDLPGTVGKKHSLSDYSNHSAVSIVVSRVVLPGSVRDFV